MKKISVATLTISLASLNIYPAQADIFTNGPYYEGQSYNSDWDWCWLNFSKCMENVGTKLDPVNSGWNDFWYQCQDPSKGVFDCFATVVTGMSLVAISGVVLATGGIAIATTGAGLLAPVAAPATLTIAPITAPLLASSTASFTGGGSTALITAPLMTSSELALIPGMPVTLGFTL